MLRVIEPSKKTAPAAKTIHAFRSSRGPHGVNVAGTLMRPQRPGAVRHAEPSKLATMKSNRIVVSTKYEGKANRDFLDAFRIRSHCSQIEPAQHYCLGPYWTGHLGTAVR